MLRGLIQYFARRVKGGAYTLDPDLPITSIFDEFLFRGYSLLRGLLLISSACTRHLVFRGKGVVLRNKSMIKLGSGVTLGSYVEINGLSKNGVIIGDRVNIGSFSAIHATGVLTNIGEGLSMGNDSAIGAYSYIGAAGGVVIESNVIMGQYVSFHSENHIYSEIAIPIRLQGVTRKGIHIEENCWVGAKVTFLDGSKIGKGSIVAAGSVVRGAYPAYSIIGGVPSKLIKNRGEGIYE